MKIDSEKKTIIINIFPSGFSDALCWIAFWGAICFCFFHLATCMKEFHPNTQKQIENVEKPKEKGF